MGSLGSRVDHLEGYESVTNDELDETVRNAEYCASVSVSFVIDMRVEKSGIRYRPSPEQIEARMIERGIPADDARRFSRMGYDAAQAELRRMFPEREGGSAGRSLLVGCAVGCRGNAA